MHIDSIGIMLANTGSDYYTTILQDLDTYNSKPQEITALKERFYTFIIVEHKSALYADITNLKKDKLEQRL